MFLIFALVTIQKVIVMALKNSQRNDGIMPFGCKTKHILLTPTITALKQNFYLNGIKRIAYIIWELKTMMIVMMTLDIILGKVLLGIMSFCKLLQT